MECTVHTVSGVAPLTVSLPAGSCAEDAVLAACRRLQVAPITRPLYALRERTSSMYLPDAAPVHPHVDYELRIRFKVSNLHHLRGLDGVTYDYYFQQARNDIVDNCVPEIKYAEHKQELLGLGIADMYRAMHEDDKSLRDVLRNYKKYIPKEIIRKHQFFAKKPIHNTLEQWCQKTTQSPAIIKAQYLEQLTRLAPNYLYEEYAVHYMPFGGHSASGSVDSVPAVLQLKPFDEKQPGLRLKEINKEKVVHLCTMEQLIFLGRKSSGTELEVCRKNGVQVYLRFRTEREMSSFISGCGGYYRLMVKWTFNLSKDDLTPSLERLYSMKCHGPVGGGFSYYKLSEKGGKRHGCFILRQCQHDYDVYYIDVCTKSNTAETYKVEFKGHCYIFNGDESKTYNSIEHLVKSFNDPEGRIYLKECLPPSEYDKSQLLLCGEQYKVGVRIDQAELQEMLKHHKSPRCINTRDILIFKGAWCYTTDANVTKDLCDVRDCTHDEGNIVLTRNGGAMRYIYMLPEWKYTGPNGGLYFSLKEWNPDFLDGILFKSFSADGTKSYTLYIGAENNEKVILSFKDDNANINKILLQKTLPHLIPAGKWGKFWIQFPKGQIKLGFQKRENPIFEWQSSNDYEVFEPAFMSYQSLEGNVIGVHFQDRQCHTENTTTLVQTRIFSLRMWRLPETKDYSNFSIYLRGTGIAVIPLLVFPRSQVLGCEGITATYKAIWKLDDKKKMEVALKTLVKEKTDTHLKEFIELANKWAGVQSSSVVRLYGVTLMSPSALVMEYLQYGPLNVFLSENRDCIKQPQLTMAAAGLARALLDLSEANCVHGRIRCSKVLLAHHDANKLTVKLSDPGLHSYTSDDIHWIPVELFSDLNLARRYTTADVWAFGTTLWEIFSYGLSPNDTNPVLRQKGYEQGHRLTCPAECPRDVWTAVLSCWSADPHRRAIPQVVMRDISHVLHRESMSGSHHPYESILGSSIGECDESYGVTVPSDDIFPRTADSSSSDTMSNTSRDTADSNVTSCHSTDITTPDHNIDFRMPDIIDMDTPSEPDIHRMQWILGMGPKSSIQLLNPIGSGNYGEVYKGLLEREGISQLQTVAVKRLKSHGDQETLKDFRKEIDIMKTLQHPNIVEILGVCEEREMLIVMEYLEHGALSFYLRHYREKIQHSDLIKYASDVASGMEYLSSKHVVHRDLAARNILVKHHRHVQISDFGLARFTTDNDVYRMKTMRDLPLNWYSPEATQGEFSNASDVWSYGVTLWEMFTYCGEEVPKLDLTALKSRADCFAMPRDCPQEVYRRLMLPCWNYRPELRPKFIQLVQICKQFQLAY